MIPGTATPHKPGDPVRVLFFADAGPLVGGGHVMRCLTLAEALAARGAACGFIAIPAAGPVLEVFAGPDIERIAVTGDSAEALAAAAARWSASAMVIDHYGFECGHEARLRETVRPLLVLDDLRRRHDCDVVLDSNLGRAAGDYPGVEALIGPDYALVRPAFAALRETALARRALNDPPRRLLVSLGLTDVGGITARVIENLLPSLGDLTLDVVLGAGAPSLERLQALAASDARVRLHVNAQDMPALTAEADLAIGAGGSSTWERGCLGLPTIALVLADNQRPNALALEAAGASVVIEAGAEDFENQLRTAVRDLVGDEAARQAMSQAAAALCDGQGAGRVADRLLSMIAPRAP